MQVATSEMLANRKSTQVNNHLSSSASVLDNVIIKFDKKRHSDFAAIGNREFKSSINKLAISPSWMLNDGSSSVSRLQ